ncbi:MAG: hypothetical protein F6J90_34130 [Moorea sp. SIOASIH]|uniref:hypothetical protein n=1 Tax=Moorena sp. SIOASIH TaxID=2607817 RepID=UPI0013B5C53D|nr:hypothetical protein [Moorena sp. SIOASIH]NEO41090.1 hypothetical protein [Moorena sp. SIOASIH]
MLPRGLIQLAHFFTVIKCALAKPKKRSKLMLKVFQRFTVILLSVTLIFVSLATKPALASPYEIKTLTKVYVVEDEYEYNDIVNEVHYEWGTQLIVPNTDHICTDGKTDAIAVYVNVDGYHPIDIGSKHTIPVPQGLTTLVIGQPKRFYDGIGSADTRVIPVIDNRQDIQEILDNQGEGFLVFSPEYLVGAYGLTCNDVQDFPITGETDLIEFIFDSTGLDIPPIKPITISPNNPPLFVVVTQSELLSKDFYDALESADFSLITQ